MNRQIDNGFFLKNKHREEGSIEMAGEQRRASRHEFFFFLIFFINSSLEDVALSLERCKREGGRGEVRTWRDGMGRVRVR